MFFRTLVWIRRCGRSGPESVLNPPKHMPLLEVATRTSFVLLADDRDREIVVGTVVIAPPGFQSGALRPEDFSKIHEPGFAVAAMNFLIEDADPSVVRVTTETRVHATDAATGRRFAMYWRVIYPGSAFIRRMWVRAIKRRAEK